MSTHSHPFSTRKTTAASLLFIVLVALLAILSPRLSNVVVVTLPQLSPARFTASRVASLFRISITPRAFSKMAYEKEQQVAIAAVLKACDVAQATFQKLVNDETVTKKDKSPVTGR
jgi:hypothetical protein